MYHHVLSLSMQRFNTTQPWEAVIAFLAASQPAEEGVFGKAFCHFDLFKVEKFQTVADESDKSKQDIMCTLVI